MFRGLRIKALYLIAQKKLAGSSDGAGGQCGKPFWISKKITQLFGQPCRNSGRIKARRIDYDPGLRRDDILRPAEIEAGDRQSLAKGFENHPPCTVVQAGKDENVMSVVET